MDENEKSGSQEVSESNVNDVMAQEALKSLHAQPADQSKSDTQKEESLTEETKETSSTDAKPDDKAAEEGKETEKVSEEVKSEKVAAEKKASYTPEEISRILESGEKADTSRMSPETQVYYREMQKGMTRKFQMQADEHKRKLDDIAKREKALRDKEIEDEERKLRAEEEVLDPEHAKDRQEKRKISREKDDLAERMKLIEQRMEVEQRQKVADQNDREFDSVSESLNFPKDQELTPLLQDAAYAYLWARNVGAMQMGQPSMSISEGAKAFTDIIGLTNPGNLKKIVNANPKFKEAYEKEIIENYLKKKSDGPTTIRSTSATAKEKTESDEKFDRKLLDDPNVNPQELMEQEALKLLRKIK